MTTLNRATFEVAGTSLAMLVRPGTLDEAILLEVARTYPIRELIDRFRSQRAVTIFDVGAHIGAFSVTIARLLPQAIVHAFEPAPENFDVLQQNIRQAGMERRVLATHAGISGGRRGFFAADDIGRSPDLRNTGGHSVMGAQVHDRALPDGRTSVELIDLGSLLDHETRVDVLKIDCEGSEFDILYSLTSEQLAKIDSMVGEIHSCHGFASSATNGMAWNAEALKGYLGRRFSSVRSDHRTETDTATLETFYATNLRPSLFERVKEATRRMAMRAPVRSP